MKPLKLNDAFGFIVFILFLVLIRLTEAENKDFCVVRSLQVHWSTLTSTGEYCTLHYTVTYLSIYTLFIEDTIFKYI